MDAESFKKEFLPYHRKLYCIAYRLLENAADEMCIRDSLSHMAEVRFSKGELIISEGERNSNF